jgi:hypothetical protein
MEIIGIAQSPAEIAGLLDLQRRRLGLVNLCLDDVAGLQQGYSAKIFAGVKRLGDMSMPAMIGATGCKLVVVHDPDWIPAVTRQHIGSSIGGLGGHSWNRRPILLPDRAYVFCEIPGERLMLTYQPPADAAA